MAVDLIALERVDGDLEMRVDDSGPCFACFFKSILDYIIYGTIVV